MLNQIKLFFEQHLALSGPEDSLEEKLHIATVVLFLEMMTMDDKVDPREQEVILSLIHQNFSLTDEQTTLLLRWPNKKENRRRIILSLLP